MANQKLLNDFLEGEGIRISFFNSPYSLNIFLNHGNKSLYLAASGHDSRLYVLKEKAFGKDIRVLFSAREDKDFIVAIRERFDPVYITYILIFDNKLPFVEYSERFELIIDTEAVSNLAERRLKHDHDLFIKKHPDVRFEKIGQNHKAELMQFLDRWDAWPATPRLKGVENDRLFVDLYLSDPNIGGEVAIDGDKIIGFAAFVPDMSGKTLSVYSTNA